MTEQKLLFAIGDVCSALTIGRTSVYELIKRGDLDVVHIGRRCLVTAESMRAFVERLKDSTATEEEVDSGDRDLLLDEKKTSPDGLAA